MMSAERFIFWWIVVVVRMWSGISFGNEHDFYVCCLQGLEANDVAESVLYALSAPPHVQVNRTLILFNTSIYIVCLTVLLLCTNLSIPNKGNIINLIWTIVGIVLQWRK